VIVENAAKRISDVRRLILHKLNNALRANGSTPQIPDWRDAGSSKKAIQWKSIWTSSTIAGLIPVTTASGSSPCEARVVYRRTNSQCLLDLTAVYPNVTMPKNNEGANIRKQGVSS